MMATRFLGYVLAQNGDVFYFNNLIDDTYCLYAISTRHSRLIPSRALKLFLDKHPDISPIF